MHARNPYKTPPDFRALATAYPALLPCIIPAPAGTVTIDFKDEVAQRRLTEALLHRDFGISLEVPMNRLCPPVPNRLNYVLWIQDILDAAGPVDPQRIYGIDIGTGASAIYPLLSCKLSPDWNFVATDVDELSLACARSNVEKNGLLGRIEIFEASAEGAIYAPITRDPTSRFDFTMCNPPFYSSPDDVAASAHAKEFEPNAVCTGADVEMITPGGESLFVRRMVLESMQLGERCRWYTSMLGKMASLTEVVSALRENSIENYGITEFVQGTTRRWAIVWSFSDLRLPDAIARISNPHLQSIMPPRNTLRQPFQFLENGAERIVDILAGALASVDGARVSRDDASEHPTFTIHATHNTWSRAARRKQRQNADALLSAEPSTPNLTCCMQWIFPAPEDANSPEIVLECRWIHGKDRALFEGFSSHVSRKVAVALTTV